MVTAAIARTSGAAAPTSNDTAASSPGPEEARDDGDRYCEDRCPDVVLKATRSDKGGDEGDDELGHEVVLPTIVGVGTPRQQQLSPCSEDSSLDGEVTFRRVAAGGGSVAAPPPPVPGSPSDATGGLGPKAKKAAAALVAAAVKGTPSGGKKRLGRSFKKIFGRSKGGQGSGASVCSTGSRDSRGSSCATGSLSATAAVTPKSAPPKSVVLGAPSEAAAAASAASSVRQQPSSDSTEATSAVDSPEPPLLERMRSTDLISQHSSSSSEGDESDADARDRSVERLRTSRTPLTDAILDAGPPPDGGGAAAAPSPSAEQGAGAGAGGGQRRLPHPPRQRVRGVADPNPAAAAFSRGIPSPKSPTPDPCSARDVITELAAVVSSPVVTPSQRRLSAGGGRSPPRYAAGAATAAPTQVPVAAVAADKSRSESPADDMVSALTRAVAKTGGALAEDARKLSVLGSDDSNEDNRRGGGVSGGDETESAVEPLPDFASPEEDRDVRTFFKSLLRTPGNPKSLGGRPPHPLATLGGGKKATTIKKGDAVPLEKQAETGGRESVSPADDGGDGAASMSDNVRRRLLLPKCRDGGELAGTETDSSLTSNTQGGEADAGAAVSGQKSKENKAGVAPPNVAANGAGNRDSPTEQVLGGDRGGGAVLSPSPSGSAVSVVSSHLEEALRINLGLSGDDASVGSSSMSPRRSRRSSRGSAAGSAAGADGGERIRGGGGGDGPSPRPAPPPSSATAAMSRDALLEGLSHRYSPSEHAPKYSETELRAKIDAAVLESERGWTEKLRATADAAAEEAENQRLRSIAEMEAEVVEERARREEDERRLREEAERHLIEEVEKLRREHEAELASLAEEKERQMEAERRRWDAETEQKIREQREEHERALSAAAAAAAEDSDDLLAEDDEAEKQREELVGTITSLERQLAERKALYEAELQGVRDQQTAEIDELIKQLDAVEAEHAARYEKMKAELGQRDAVISAVGAQLAEANLTTEALRRELADLTSELEAARREATAAREAISELERSVESLRVEHVRAMDEESKRRAAACEEVKADMIRQAEEQFAAANAHYLKLKGEYEGEKEKRARLENELQRVRDEAGKAERERNAKEVEIMADVAQLKAALAAAEANAARTAQKYASEIESMQVEEQKLRAELEEQRTACSTAHMSLATVVAEKERLVRENAELNSVCEEIMAMVEGQGDDL